MSRPRRKKWIIVRVQPGIDVSYLGPNGIYLDNPFAAVLFSSMENVKAIARAMSFGKQADHHEVHEIELTYLGWPGDDDE